MADQWNDNIPVLTNQIANDIPDIEENFGWIQQVLKILIGWKTSTIATVSPPGPQRSKFVCTSDTVLNIGPGVYFHDGTTRQTVFWDAALAFTLGSGGSNAASEDLGASEWHYIYLDDSAIVTKGGPELDNTCILNNTTAPTWSDAKHGWYNGSDRCIFAIYSDGDSDQLEFFHDGGGYVVFAAQVDDRSSAGLSNTYTDVTLTIPGFSTKAFVLLSSSYVDADTSLIWRTNGQTATNGHYSGTVTAGTTYSMTNAVVLTDSAQTIEVKHSAATTNTGGVSTHGFYLPTGM